MEQLSLTDNTSPTKRHLEHPLFNMLASHIVDKFWLYHQENPHIFELYLRFSRELKNSGRQFYGAKAITERIRWHVAVETKGEDFKIGNNHVSCYARLLTIMHPELEGLFHFRMSPGTVPMEERV